MPRISTVIISPICSTVRICMVLKQSPNGVKSKTPHAVRATQRPFHLGRTDSSSATVIGVGMSRAANCSNRFKQATRSVRWSRTSMVKKETMSSLQTMFHPICCCLANEMKARVIVFWSSAQRRRESPWTASDALKRAWASRAATKIAMGSWI